MERDEESGLEYHSARYYVSWLGRWVSTDPLGLGDGINLYCYCTNRPTRKIDKNGKQSEEKPSNWTRFFGGLRLVGGVLETVAGGGLIAAGVVTSPTGIGAVAGVGGGLIVGAHGLDTIQAGARQLWTGQHTDSLTSTGLQALGVSKPVANIVDAGISVVGTLGASAITRAPTVVTAVAEGGATVEAVTTAAPAITVVLRPALGAGHNYVAVTTADNITTWSHLAVDATTRSGPLVTGGTSFVEGIETADMARRLSGPLTTSVTVPVSGAEASAALATVNRAIQVTEAGGTAGYGSYGLVTNSCSTYAASVLNAGGVATPGITSPLVNLTAAALRAPAVMQPVTTAGTLISVTTGVDTVVNSTDDSMTTSANSCYAEPNQVDYSTMVCR